MKYIANGKALFVINDDRDAVVISDRGKEQGEQQGI
jgi:hypothetical protein